MASPLFDLTGKVAVVTGSSKGIGKSIAMHLALQGAKVVVSSRKKPACDEAAEEIRKAGGEAIVIPCNISDKAQCENLIAETRRQLGPIDVLVCNAGIFLGRDWKLGATDFDGFEQTLRTNVLAPLRVVEALVEPVARSERKQIVLMSSRMGSNAQSTGGSMPYRVSKAALNSVAKNLSIELAPRGITTVCTHPGWVRTDMGGPNATLGVEESVAGILSVVDGLTLADTRRYLDYRGADIDW